MVETAGLDEAGIVNALVSGLRAVFQELEETDAQASYAARCRDWADRFSWKRMHGEVVDVVTQELSARGR